MRASMQMRHGSEADVEVMDSDGDGVPDHLDHFPRDPDELPTLMVMEWVMWVFNDHQNQ